MKTICVFLVTFLIVYATCGQSEMSEDHVATEDTAQVFYYTTLSASVGYISWHIDVEQTIVQFTKSYINLRIGYGLWSDWGGSGDNIYLSGKYLFGFRNSHLETDLGIRFQIDDCCGESWIYNLNNIYSIDYIPLINIGYRYEKPDGGFMFRVGIGSESIVNIGFGYKIKY